MEKKVQKLAEQNNSLKERIESREKNDYELNQEVSKQNKTKKQN